MSDHTLPHYPIPGFSRCDEVYGRHSIADLFAPGERCGIYILHFSDGWFYVGQAVDVTRRFVQHRKTHTDIERISFSPVALDWLDEKERDAVRRMEEAGCQLRNIALVTMPFGETDFDELMPPDVQERWLAGMDYSEPIAPRQVDTSQRMKYRAKCEQFCALPASRDAIGILRAYMQTCVPAVVSGEQSFWSCTCLPGKSNPELTILSRINLNWQEVFTLFLSGGIVGGTLHLARSSLGEGVAGAPFRQRLRWRYNAELDLSNRYAPGGEDQCAFTVYGAKNLSRVLREQPIIAAARLFNLRLCRKGPNPFSRYHCLDLADQLIAQE